MSWDISILHYIGREAVYRKLNLSTAIDTQPNRPATSTPIREFNCPSAKSDMRDSADPASDKEVLPAEW